LNGAQSPSAYLGRRAGAGVFFFFCFPWGLKTSGHGGRQPPSPREFAHRASGKWAANLPEAKTRKSPPKKNSRFREAAWKKKLGAKPLNGGAKRFLIEVAGSYAEKQAKGTGGPKTGGSGHTWGLGEGVRACGDGPGRLKFGLPGVGFPFQEGKKRFLKGVKGLWGSGHFSKRIGPRIVRVKFVSGHTKKDLHIHKKVGEGMEGMGFWARAGGRGGLWGFGPGGAAKPHTGVPNPKMSGRSRFSKTAGTVGHRDEGIGKPFQLVFRGAPQAFSRSTPGPLTRIFSRHGFFFGKLDERRIGGHTTRLGQEKREGRGVRDGTPHGRSRGGGPWLSAVDRRGVILARPDEIEWTDRGGTGGPPQLDGGLVAVRPPMAWASRPQRKKKRKGGKKAAGEKATGGGGIFRGRQNSGPLGRKTPGGPDQC